MDATRGKDQGQAHDASGVAPTDGYVRPTLTRLGDMTALTLKEVGAADGFTFQGIDQGSL